MYPSGAVVTGARMDGDSTIKIGLLGCGSIGRELARSVGSPCIPNARLAAVADRDEQTASALAAMLEGDVAVLPHPAELASAAVDLVVECASPSAVREFGPSILEAGKSLLLMSSAALLDGAIFDRMSAACRRHGVEVIVPSGAVGGIDALRAAREFLHEVTIVLTKRPEALVGAPGFAEWEGCRFDGPTVVYEGPALEAVELFPANVNVAATVSLAGVGPRATRVKVVADPESPGNVHEVRASGRFGEMHLRFVNQPNPANPKTSHLAVLAAIEALRSFCERGPRIGT